MSVKNILDAIAARLDSLTPTVTTFWPNQKYEKSINTSHQIVNIFPNRTEMFTGGTSKETGFVQVSLWYPEGFGTDDVFARADAVRTHFFPANGAGLSLTSGGQEVRILENPQVRAPIPTEGWYHLPIDVHYLAYVQPT